MPKLPPPPVIEGTLKEPIYALSFGILVSMWSMNIGSLLTPHYFAYIVSIVFAFECFLWFLDKPRKDYEVYTPLTRDELAGSKGKTPVSSPASTPSKETSGDSRSSKMSDDGAKLKKLGIPVRSQREAGEGKAEQKSGKESRFRFRHKKNNDQPESPVQ